MALRVLNLLFLCSFSAVCQGKKHLHEIKFDQCGEAAVDPLIFDALVDFGLTEGTCTEQGYDAAAGSKEIDVPLVGKIALELYAKKHRKHRIRARIVEGSIEEYVHMWKLSTDRCFEAFIHPTLKEPFVETAFSEGTCAGQGYDVPAGAEQITLPYIGAVDVTVDLGVFRKHSLVGETPNTVGNLHNSQDSLKNKVHVWRIFAGQCGEAFVDSMAKGALVEQGFVEGTCAEQGYDVEAGHQEVDVSLVGKVWLELYDKKLRFRLNITEGSTDKEPRLRTGVVEGSVENHVHACKVSHGQCSEVFIDPVMLGGLAETTFSEGTCAEQGFDVPAGFEEISMPYIGGVDITIDVYLYSKPSRRL